MLQVLTMSQILTAQAGARDSLGKASNMLGVALMTLIIVILSLRALF